MSEMKILVRVENLVKHFPIPGSWLSKRMGTKVRAVDGINLDIHSHQTLGLVGESGSGKSTTGRVLLLIEPPTSGKVYFRGVELTKTNPRELRQYRRHMSMVFQDPYSSIDPRMKVGDIIREPLDIHRIGSRREQIARVRELLSVVGLSPDFIGRYPHQFSGGQRQRIGIARALALQPNFIVCDEPVSALDVSIRSQVLNLLKDLQEKFELTYLLISHDLSVIRHVSDQVAVMYLGKIVELASTDELYSFPLHPYTQALFSSIPIPNPSLERKRKQVILQGDIPNPAQPPPGCRFHTRCPLVKEICREIEPALREVSPGHRVACHLV